MWSLITSQPASSPTRSSQMQEEDLQGLQSLDQREVERYGCHEGSNPPSVSSEQSSPEDSEEEFFEESVKI
ncbi:unnamed protein product [Cylicocyclus nassatus]|uniref:Uncharacterized protein n=1 Tax=Cylicocyclus nassatus TaxID=53992 RepID=A0AA36GZZ5_CYLNA|nr:unnamed protein product [Cylicocyclus nassatus]